VRTHRDYRFAPLFDRIHHAPKGYDGGADGALATISLSTGEAITQKGTLDLGAETEITLNLPGGGGLGDPSQRDPTLIERDIRNGLVSAESAGRDYGLSEAPAGIGAKLARV
jgi:N-methylhydantoinase B